MIADIKAMLRNILRLDREVAVQKMLSGRILSRMNAQNEAAILQNLQEAEFKVYSQWGDDGIIDFLVQYLDLEVHKFVEFGVENYREANTRFLLQHRNWKGLVMDGSEKNIETIKSDPISWQYDLSAVCAFIETDNINRLLEKHGFSGQLGILHIDIDGNDYWVWKAIQVADPDIVIMEYNAVWGATNPWTVPYKADFFRTQVHFSNLYFGSSLLSLCDLAAEKGYAFVGCNMAGNNAYFVKKSKIKGLKIKDPVADFVDAAFKESRDEKGKLTYLSGSDRLQALKGMPIWNTRTGKMDTI